MGRQGLLVRLVLRVHLVLQDLQGRLRHRVDHEVGGGAACVRMDVQLGLRVLLKEDELMRRPCKIICFSYLGLLVLQVRLDRLDRRARLRAVRLSVHFRNREQLYM